jgi:hypothetical protein
MIFCGFFLFCKIPPLSVFRGPIFIGKNIARFSNLVPQLLFFFVNLIFLIFFVFFKNEQYQCRLNEENQ